MKPYEIKQPIYGSFKGKYYPQSIGVATFRVGSTGIYLTIAAKDKRGHKKWPHVYFINRERIKRYPIEEVKGIKLYIVPIADLDIYEEKSHI